MIQQNKRSVNTKIRSHIQDLKLLFLSKNLPENTVSQLNPEGKIEENIQDNPATVDPNDPNVNSPNQ